MPYIKQDKRNVLDQAINDLHDALVGLELDDESNNMEGNLNYSITRLLRMCYSDSYREINDAMGVLSCVMMEHYRTKAVPLENQKMYENGDVDENIEPIMLTEVVVKASEPESGC